MDHFFNPAMMFRIALIVAIAIGLYHLAARGSARLRGREYISENTRFLLNTAARWTIIAVGVILVVQTLGVSVHALWTTLSALMVMVAIGFVAMWSVLSNLLCAVLLVAFAPFRIGDEIELIEVTMKEADKRGIRGRVVAINMLYTLLEESDAEKGTIRIPNNLLFQRAIRTIAGTDTTSLGQSLFKDGGEP